MKLVHPRNQITEIISRIYNHKSDYHFLCIEDTREKKKIDENVKKLLDKKFKKIN